MNDFFYQSGFIIAAKLIGHACDLCCYQLSLGQTLCVVTCLINLNIMKLFVLRNHVEFWREKCVTCSMSINVQNLAIDLVGVALGVFAAVEITQRVRSALDSKRRNAGSEAVTEAFRDTGTDDRLMGIGKQILSQERAPA